MLEIGGADRVIIPFDYIPYPDKILAEMRAIIFPDEITTAEGPVAEDEPSAAD
jgi:hypothetical protein